MSNTYKDLTDFLTNMSDQQAANILKNHVEIFNISKSSTKILNTIVYITAMNKAISALENTSKDKKAELTMGEPMIEGKR